MSNSNLPASLTNLATALTTATQESGGSATGGELYLRFTKLGRWEFGADGTEVEEGATFAINPMAFEYGWICWDENNMRGGPTGEVMVPAGAPRPQESELPAVNGRWSKAYSMQLKCLGGEDEGLQFIYKANSMGAEKAFNHVTGEIAKRLVAGDDACVPVVELHGDSYENKRYGLIQTPDIRIVDWVTMDGDAAEPAAAAVEAPAEEEEAPAEEAAPRRRKRTRKAA